MHFQGLFYYKFMVNLDVIYLFIFNFSYLNKLIIIDSLF